MKCVRCPDKIKIPHEDPLTKEIVCLRCFLSIGKTIRIQDLYEKLGKCLEFVREIATISHFKNSELLATGKDQGYACAIIQARELLEELGELPE